MGNQNFQPQPKTPQKKNQNKTPKASVLFLAKEYSLTLNICSKKAESIMAKRAYMLLMVLSSISWASPDFLTLKNVLMGMIF